MRIWQKIAEIEGGFTVHLYKNILIILICIALQFLIYFLIQVDFLHVSEGRKNELKYTNFFDFWWKSNVLRFNTHDEYKIIGIFYAFVFFWLIDGIILYNIPFAILGLKKLKRGEYSGKDKLSDLIRATVYVDETKPE